MCDSRRSRLLDAAIKQIKPDLFQDYEIFKSREMLLEWCPKNVHKATGLAALASILGLEADQVMACGDEANDLSMIQWLDWGCHGQCDSSSEGSCNACGPCDQ